MKEAGLAVLGVFAALISLTLFGSSSFVGVALLYGFLTFFLFFATHPRPAYIFLIAATVGLELLGAQHFGVASAMALVLWLVHHLLGLQSRFTSLFPRYIVALLITLLGYALLFFPLSGLGHRLLILVPVAIIVIIFGLYRTASQSGPAYELI